MSSWQQPMDLTLEHMLPDSSTFPALSALLGEHAPDNPFQDFGQQALELRGISLDRLGNLAWTYPE
eukprot:3806578-Amphidinium_carterae.1